MHVPIPLARPLAACGLLLAAACAPAAPPVAAPPPAQEGAFVVRLGTDTTFVERYTRTADRLEGEVVARSPRTATRRYVAELRPDGTIGRFEVTLETPGMSPAPPPVRYVVEPEGDSLAVRLERGDSVRVTRVAAGPGVIPYLRGSYALYEQAVRQARAAGGDSASVALYPVGAREAAPLGVRVLGPDAARIHDIAGPVEVHLDAAGRIVRADGGSTGMTVERVPTLDAMAMAAEYARRDREGRGLGVLSPRDSLRAMVGGATIAVDYGRPLRRGRTVMGGVVPWNEVWRTGANEATHFRTDRDLEMGGVTIPAGTYTLWTIPSPSGWKLLVNRRTGQWGTVYEAADDLARIDMQVETLPQTVEQLTISVEPRGERSGVLSVAWENTRASVPFTVR